MGEVREGFWRRHRILLVSRIPGRAARDPGPKAMRICSWTPDRLRRPGMWSPSEIHHRKDLLPDERVARIVAVSAAGNFRPDLTPEIHCHSIGRLPCLRVFDFDGAPDADVQCFEMREVGDEF